MTCPEYRDRLEDVLDGLLPPEDAERLDAHRAACEDCAAQWDEAVRFRALLDSAGRDALGAWEARRLAVRAATLQPVDAGLNAGLDAPTATPRRFTILRLAAAAAVIAAAGFVGSGLLGDPGPVRLAYGAETRLGPGTQATFGHDCRLVVEDRAATFTLRAATPDDGIDGGDVLQMERGVALFHVHPEHALGVATPQGLARAVGATFVVDVRSDGAVSVDVVTGRVRLERSHDDVVVARPGERVEVDSGGVAHVVSRARIDDLELRNQRHNEAIETLQAQLDRAEQQIDDYIQALPEGGDIIDEGDEIPLLQLGRAMAVLADRSIPWRDDRRNEATGKFLMSAKQLKAEFGVSDPMRALESPSFVAAVADGFLNALAPEVDDAAIALAADDLRRACGVLEADMAGDPLPTEVAAARQRALVDIIRAAERRLGVATAVRVVHAFRGEWDGPAPMVQDLDDRTEAKIVGFWQRSLSLGDDETNRLAALVREYVAQSVAMQQRVAAALPADDVDAVLYPRSRFGAGGFSRGGWKRGEGDRNGGGEPDADDGGAPTDATSAGRERGNWSGGGSWGGWGFGKRDDKQVDERSDSEIVAARLRELDARMHLSEPRIRFERGLWNLLTPEQRERAFRGGARLPTFRPRNAQR